MNPARLPRLAAVLLWTFASLQSPATADSKLPWKDANPVEGLSTGAGRAKDRSKEKPIPAAALTPAAPPTDAVPVPAQRPAGGEGEGDGKAETDDAEPAGPAPLSAEPAIPQARPDPAEASGDATGQGGAALVKALPEAPGGAATEAVAKTPPADGGEAAAKPVGEIPLPEERPSPAPPEPPASKAQAPVSSEAGSSTPQQADEVTDEAPNSTEKLKSRTAAITSEASVLAAAAVADAELCETELSRRGAAFTVGDSISEGECGVLRPVNVTRLSSGIKVSPRTQLLCRTVLALDDWMKDGVVPAARTALPGETLAEFRNAATYVCRPRASEAGISEHARGSAIDIATFVFASGKEIGIAAQAAGSPEERFQAEVRTKACGPFKTVLGPGTDADHATHFHLDIASRRNGSTYCR